MGRRARSRRTGYTAAHSVLDEVARYGTGMHEALELWRRGPESLRVAAGPGGAARMALERFPEALRGGTSWSDPAADPLGDVMATIERARRLYDDLVMDTVTRLAHGLGVAHVKSVDLGIVGFSPTGASLCESVSSRQIAKLWTFSLPSGFDVRWFEAEFTATGPFAWDFWSNASYAPVWGRQVGKQRMYEEFVRQQKERRAIRNGRLQDSVPKRNYFREFIYPMERIRRHVDEGRPIYLEPPSRP